MYSKYAELRDKRGITDYKVSQETGVSTATLSSWKSGAYTPKADKLMKIAEFFGIGVEELLKDEGKVTA